MTNQSLRKRFRIHKTNYPQVSKVIKNAVQEGLIKFEDPESTTGKAASYIPFWA